MEALLSCLRPDFTWPRQLGPVSKSAPRVPSLPGKLQRKLWGLVHSALYRFSEVYSRWYGLDFDGKVMDLPFGLILKWTDRTSLEEVAAMKMARAAGMPVPKVLSCGKHPNDSFNRYFSILMTRLPGITFNNDPWVADLEECVAAMRQWSPPHPERISSVINTSMRSARVPDHVMGPFANQSYFHDFLLSPTSSHGFDSTEEFSKALVQANDIRNYNHRITFTHGDFKLHNILVDDDGHLSGFLDWESAGWLPEFWGFTTAMRFGRDSAWYEVASWIGGDQYSRELACDIALNSLTVDSYIAF